MPAPKSTMRFSHQQRRLKNHTAVFSLQTRKEQGNLLRYFSIGWSSPFSVFQPRERAPQWWWGLPPRVLHVVFVSFHACYSLSWHKFHENFWSRDSVISMAARCTRPSKSWRSTSETYSAEMLQWWMSKVSSISKNGPHLTVPVDGTFSGWLKYWWGNAWCSCNRPLYNEFTLRMARPKLV